MATSSGFDLDSSRAPILGTMALTQRSLPLDPGADDGRSWLVTDAWRAKGLS
ncbi:MAG: hypothetical protein ACYDB7_10275 [Mycobacteriales bacterium]